jgi:hypothetical protein
MDESRAGGLLKGSVPVDILNISGGGMQFQVANSLRPGALYELKAQLSGLPFAAQVVVTRCVATGAVQDGKGGRTMIYRAGAAIVQIDDATAEELREWLARRGAHAHVTSASLEN